MSAKVPAAEGTRPKGIRPSAAALVGRVLAGRFRVDSVIASGGMGTVFRAHHLALQRDVALKALHAELVTDEVSRKRFEREARSASLLDHPNCLRVHDYGQDPDGTVFLVMDLLEGRSLEGVLGRAMPIERALSIARQILDGLDHAHHQRLVHRDLKPENIVLVRDSRGREVVKIVDFGIAKLLEGDQNRERLTRTGFVFGTPTYMSPEQALGRDIGPWTDLYAFGLILFEMLAGYAAFSAPDNLSLMRMHVSSAPARLPADTDPELVRIVERLLAKEAQHRPASAQEVLIALERVGKRGRARDSSGERPRPSARAARSQSNVPGTRGGAGRTVALCLVGVAVLGLGIGVGVVAFDRFGVAAAPPIPAPSDPTSEREFVELPDLEDLEDAVLAAPAPATEQPPAVTRVRLTIASANDGQIIDPHDGAIYGRTNRPFELDRSEEAIDLVLRVPGRADEPLRIVPDRDKVFDVALESNHDEPQTKAMLSKKTEPDPVAPPPAAEPAKTKKPVDENLIDPFARSKPASEGPASE